MKGRTSRKGPAQVRLTVTGSDCPQATLRSALVVAGKWGEGRGEQTGVGWGVGVGEDGLLCQTFV